MRNNIETIVLHRAKLLLDCKERWPLGAGAHDKDARPCDPLSSRCEPVVRMGSVAKMCLRPPGSEHAARTIANTVSEDLVAAPGGPPFANERGCELVQMVLRAGGPPSGAGGGWPFNVSVRAKGSALLPAKMNVDDYSWSRRRISIHPDIPKRHVAVEWSVTDQRRVTNGCKFGGRTWVDS
jgi:hypothetical protein